MTLRLALIALPLAAFSAQQSSLNLPTLSEETYVAAVHALQDKMTERQRAVGKLFDRYGMPGAGILVGRSVSINLHEGVAVSPIRPSLASYYGPKFCTADTVVVGRVVESHSFPIESGTYLFTEYRFVLAEAPLANRANQPMLSGRSINVYRTGGRIVLNGTQVSAGRSDLPGFEIEREYLLFLSYDKEADALLSTESTDSLELVGGMANSVRQVALADADSRKLSIDRLKQVFATQYCR